jgi:acetolactate synthase-1/2/3 large subunit
MKGSDFIVSFLISRGIKHIFGYPGGMVTHILDSLTKQRSQIEYHICCDERAAAFAACGYAQAGAEIGVAFATSGPGATNLITGISNAYFDSIPVLFITGQVNTFERCNEHNVRQKGFQETDIVSMVKGVTKYCAFVNNVDNLPAELEKAYEAAVSGRKGPVLLDIPMDVQRNYLKYVRQVPTNKEIRRSNCDYTIILDLLNVSKRPCIVVGAGVKQERFVKEMREFLSKTGVPIVSSMIAVDVCSGLENYYGFIGAYGDRTANFIVAKADLIISFGSRLDIRQVGAKRDQFAPGAKIIRVDIDPKELEYSIRDDLCICSDLRDVVDWLSSYDSIYHADKKWIDICNIIRESLSGFDTNPENGLIQKISADIPDDITITTDVGQNQVWVAQSFIFKPKQQLLASGGFGSMGYSLPAAIGAFYHTGKPVLCFCGDGGLQMCISELHTISVNKLPITVVVLNNNALGMIRHFQEMFFNKCYSGTTADSGFRSMDFVKVADSMGVKSKILPDSGKMEMAFDGPSLLEVIIDKDTYVVPKLEYGKPNQDQFPCIDRDLYSYLNML